MKRLVILLGLLVLAGLFAACGGGGGDEDGETLPLEVQFVAASPNAGTQPLRVVLTVVITGGKAPFFYAWDFTNDGAPDSFDNGQYSRTVNVQNEYYLRVSDAGVDSVYEVGLTVTDSKGTVVTPDPVTVTVYALGGLEVNPFATGWTSGADDGQAHSGEPVQFTVEATGGQAPYTYEWDFDNDGGTDSRIPNPQHTFYYNGPKSFEIFPVGITITDANGQVLGTRDEFGDLKISDNVLYVTVAAPGFTFPDDAGFEITLSSFPASIPGSPYPVIEINYDPTQAEPDQIPLEPKLDLSVVIDPLGTAGIPPFEYYWDFDNDGAIETQDQSPTIPFYDFRRRILINPYTHTLDEMTFILRCMVLDGAGRQQNAYRTVVVKNVASSIDLKVVPDYGVMDNEVMGGPFGLVRDSNSDGDLRDELTDVVFRFVLSGSTGEYDYQFDANGDGVPEVPAAGGFEPAAGNVITIDSTKLDPYQGVGYFPANITVRSLQSGVPAQITKVEVPVSLVGRQAKPYEGDLLVRAGHSVEASWSTLAGGDNGTYLVSREMVIAGGAQGNAVLRNVEKVTEYFSSDSPPAPAGEIEEAESMIATERSPLLQARKGAMIWTEGSNYYVHGGETDDATIIATVESIPINDNDGLVPWDFLSPILGYFPLKYGMGVRVTDVDNTIFPYDMSGQSADIYDALIFCGGRYPPQGSDSDVVSWLTVVYRSLIWPDGNVLVPPQIDGYVTVGSGMITPRYEGCAVWNPDNRMLYIVGGRVPSGQSTATVEVFDIDTRQWENRPPMNYPRAGGVAKFIGGQIYIMGGSYYPEDEGQQVVLDTAEVYNPATGIWSETLPPSFPTHQPGAASLPGPGSVSNLGVNINTIWYFGGSTDLGETNSFEEFVYFHDVPLPVPAP